MHNLSNFPLAHFTDHLHRDTYSVMLSAKAVYSSWFSSVGFIRIFWLSVCPCCITEHSAIALTSGN